MIKFFRKIRKNLLIENKAGKYFKYAIGEIILVVIGILIALTINNWNQNRIQNQKTKVIFNQIISELVLDIKIIQDVNNVYLNKKSLIDEFVNTDFKNIKSQNKETIDESKLINMIRTYAPLTIHDRGFNLLMNQTDELNNQYKEYIEELLFLYEDVRFQIDGYNLRLEQMLGEHRMYKIKNHDWYSYGVLDEKGKKEELDYYKYNPTYRNYVSYYNEMIINIVIPARLFSDKAIKLCRKINSDFKLNRDIDEELSFTNPPSEILQNVIGTYVTKKNDTLLFEERNNQLYESTFDGRDFDYYTNPYIIVGDLRYLSDSIFYRNVRENLQLNADGSLTLINVFGKEPIKLKRISK